MGGKLARSHSVDWIPARGGISLHSSPDDLMWVGEGAGEDLGEAGEEEVVCVA